MSRALFGRCQFYSLQFKNLEAFRTECGFISPNRDWSSIFTSDHWFFAIKNMDKNALFINTMIVVSSDFGVRHLKIVLFFVLNYRKYYFIQKFHSSFPKIRNSFWFKNFSYRLLVRCRLHFCSFPLPLKGFSKDPNKYIQNEMLLFQYIIFPNFEVK